MSKKKLCEGTIKKNGTCNECGYPLPQDRTKQKGSLKHGISADHGRKCKRALVWLEDKYRFISQKDWDMIKKMGERRSRHR